LRFEALAGQDAGAVAAGLKIAAIDGRVLALALHALRARAWVGANRRPSRGDHLQLTITVLFAAGHATQSRVAQIARAALAVVGRVAAAHAAAVVFGTRDVVAALLGAAAGSAAVGAAVGTGGAAVEMTDAAVAAGVALAGLGVAIGARHASGRFEAARDRITKVAGTAQRCLRRVAALTAAAFVHGATDLVVALGRAAAGTAGCARSVRAGAALLTFAAQRDRAAFTVLARANRARIFVVVALRVVAASGATRALAAQLGRRIGAEVVLAEVVLARVRGAVDLVVADAGALSGQARACLAR